MKQFKTVFNFEFATLIKNKTLIITTVVLTLISFTAASIPTIMTLFGSKDTETNDPETSLPETTSLFEGVGFVIDLDDANVYIDTMALSSDQIYATYDAMKKSVDAGTIKSGFYLKSDVAYDMYTTDISIYNDNQVRFESIIRDLKTDKILNEAGIDPSFVRESMMVDLDANVISVGKDASNGMFISYGVLFAMYMLILLYGNNVSTSVAREKDSRTMELLITSTKPRTLILGKVMATGLMGILQVVMIIGGVALGVFLSRANYPEVLLAMIGGSMTWDTVLVYVLFSALGYILYLFIFAALGSLVSKVEDVAKAVAPITYLFIVAYLVASFAMQMPDNKIVAVSSYIPFTSIFTMPIRYMLTTVSWMSVASSIAIMVVSTAVLAGLSVYIYRFGSLNYGNKISLKQVFKSLKR